MRRSILFAPALLAACSTAPAQPIVHGETRGHVCKDVGTDRFIGQQGTSANGKAIKQATNAAVLRWAPPNVMLTMDFRSDRVTVWLDEAHKITKVRCG